MELILALSAITLIIILAKDVVSRERWENFRELERARERIIELMGNCDLLREKVKKLEDEARIFGSKDEELKFLESEMPDKWPPDSEYLS